MNNVNLVGRVGSLKQTTTENGKSHVFFTLAVDNPYKESTDWIPCTVWGKDAENMIKYVRKGYRLAINGSLSTYTNKNGESAMNVNVNPGGIEFLTSKKEAEGMNRQNDSFQGTQYTNTNSRGNYQRDPFNQAPEPEFGFSETDSIPY